jgi:hypothetical protein
MAQYLWVYVDPKKLRIINCNHRFAQKFNLFIDWGLGSQRAMTSPKHLHPSIEQKKRASGKPTSTRKPGKERILLA